SGKKKNTHQKKIWLICSQLQQTKTSTGGKIPTESGRLIHRCVVSCALFSPGQISIVMDGQFKIGINS
ncbi:MAG: hypothetical protein KDE66_11600, partial [Nitrosomonas sp.]|nr:hypothetical protein [Nitrosomonas sp.]